jgi:hypothetical protein
MSLSVLYREQTPFDLCECAAVKGDLPHAIRSPFSSTSQPLVDAMSTSLKSAAGITSTVSITSAAYLKLVLHAAKHSSRSVLGLLVASASAAASSSPVTVDDVLPLFHTTPLAPAIELALTQAEAYLPASATILGVYYAGEAFEPKTNNGNLALPMPQANIAVKITEKIRENGKGAAGTRILLVSFRAAHLAR